jgi:HEAT repeat protein
MPCISKKMLPKSVVRRSILMFLISTLISVFTLPACAQTAANQGWPPLEAGLVQKSSGQRLAAVRVLGLIPDDPHATELAEKALKDDNGLVRAAAATSLGQMHASEADGSLKQALNDKNLSVVMAAAHALRLLNDPACYDAYYEIYTGERKNDSAMVAQEMKVLHDPKQLAQMGFNEGIGYIPFAGIPWEALQTIMKDKKSGAAAKAALISALATDPDRRTNKVLLATSQNQNWVLRVAALEGIAKRGDPTLLPGIEPRLSDSKPEVRFAAAAAVIHLNDVAKTPVAGTKIARAPSPTGAKEPHPTNAGMQTTN